MPKAQLTRKFSAFANETTWTTTTTTNNNKHTLFWGVTKSSILLSKSLLADVKPLQAVSCLQITATVFPNSTNIDESFQTIIIFLFFFSNQRCEEVKL